MHIEWYCRIAPTAWRGMRQAELNPDAARGGNFGGGDYGGGGEYGELSRLV